MQSTPSQTYEQVKESLAQYLETQYKIAHPVVFRERGEMLRAEQVIAQRPFVEATPSFVSRRKLAELEKLNPDILPAGLAELVQHGVPVDRFPLYVHQEQALLAAYSERPNLLVATGTGSGKTESFLLPVLSDLLREARHWEPPTGPARPGQYDVQSASWLHARRHERRPAAMRAIILYPMNALVNDQLTRLRRILALGSSPDWQLSNLNGNTLHFGMYTGLTRQPGFWDDKRRRDTLDAYLNDLAQDWHQLDDHLRETGGWPRPNSTEMLSRWDMQAAPPDVLVTNYSMLEYMLVRPIEHPMFEQTREWLATAPEARFTLVLDEAHTYTGAKGSEVAHLVRRLKERLGLEANAPQFRAIATTASVPPGQDDELLRFTGDLFGEEPGRFTLIRAAEREKTPDRRSHTEAVMRAYAKFHNEFDLREPLPAIEALAQELDWGLVDRTLKPEVALYRVAQNDPYITWIRERTARRATELDVLADECWPGLGTAELRELATAGVLAAGSFARSDEHQQTPPLLSMRIHAFFRGVPGLWACCDPTCSACDQSEQRPVGKLYTEPRPWCDCGARVLEVFTCRHCGLMYLGGLPDSIQNSLWPWSDDLSGRRQDLKNFFIFGIEQPDSRHEHDYRSTRTTLPTGPEDPFARRVYESEPTEEDGVQVSPYPMCCPRCYRYRQPGVDGREVVEPLRTRGPQSFAVLVNESFQEQPRVSVRAPNYGRKAMLFSDSRREAAVLAANLRQNHLGDLYRQVFYRVLMTCETCQGSGRIEQLGPFRIGQPRVVEQVTCTVCQGSGQTPTPAPLTYSDLKRKCIDLQMSRGINPTGELIDKFFTREASGDEGWQDLAEQRFNAAMRREVTEEQYSLEPLGLARWLVTLPEDIGQFEHLTGDESKTLLQAVVRLLASENVVTAPEPLKPWEWNKDVVEPYQRNVLASNTFKRQQRWDGSSTIPYTVETRRKLGRYLEAVAQRLDELGRLPEGATPEQWRMGLSKPLWDALYALRLIEPAGKKTQETGWRTPFGIRLNRFVLHPLGDAVQRCTACAYVMAENVLDVCLRCGHRTAQVPVSSVRNYFRRASLAARPGSGQDVPYPLRASEHTAQIGSKEARNEERWFQDLFHQDQDDLDHRVDILSVTTTMEMGIDIGSLLFVGLRNVPPTVANYQQRAGRAGRRGSALATVFTYAQPRSHDQYYFEHPPEMVSASPRVPNLNLANAVVARRHVRSLVLQDFFLHAGASAGATLFHSWGSVQEFASHQTADRLTEYIGANLAVLVSRAQRVVSAQVSPDVPATIRDWLTGLPQEVQTVVANRAPADALFEVLIQSGLLPKYAFPVDVVTLTIPAPDSVEDEHDDLSDTLQRDLKIAIAEYAPGAEIVRQSFPKTYKYRSVGVYDPFAQAPDYSAQGRVVECQTCQTVTVIALDGPEPLRCEVCDSFTLEILPYLRPRGFTVDGAERDGGREEYVASDGVERSGVASPARLLIGGSAFTQGEPCFPYPRLYAAMRVGDLVISNKGPHSAVSGYIICPTCGRALDPANPSRHRYPADVPPHRPQRGQARGPRAGQPCPHHGPYTNQVILAHRFNSEVLLLGLDLPSHMDAPFGEPSGLAAWTSFGTLIANAAARVLQIDPGELKVGTRAVQRPGQRLHGEVFLYDDVPGGAGYARAVQARLPEVLQRALILGQHCTNPRCQGACYHCLYDYGNQALHALLDRQLGADLLAYAIHGQSPSADPVAVERGVRALEEYAAASFTLEPGFRTGAVEIACVLRSPEGERYGVWPIHPLAARPGEAERQQVQAQHGVRVAVHTTFDLERRPFWVLNHLGQV